MMTNRAHLENARKLLVANDQHSLRYCALELRTCIELLCYARLSMYLDEISEEQLKSWRPQDVDKILLECDPDSDQDCTFGIAKELPGGGTAPIRVLGQSKGITKKFIQANYHKLGSFLHAPTLAEEKDSSRPSPAEMKIGLQNTLDEIEVFASGTGMTNFSTFLTFTCNECGLKNKRNLRALEEGKQVKCIGPSCPAEFVVHDLKGPAARIEPVCIPWTCDQCKTERYLLPGQIKAGKVLICDGCKISWQIGYSLRLMESPPRDSPDVSRESKVAS